MATFVALGNGCIVNLDTIHSVNVHTNGTSYIELTNDKDRFRTLSKAQTKRLLRYFNHESNGWVSDIGTLEDEED